MEPLSVTVQLTPEDLAIYLREVAQGRGRWRRVILFVLAGALIAGSYLLHQGDPGTSASDESSPLMNLPVAVMLVGVAVIVWSRWRVRRRAFWQQYAPGAMEPNLYQVLDEGIYCENTRGQSVNRWTAVERLLETEKYLYVMLAPRTGHVLPKRCFATPEAATAFAEQIRQRLGQASTT